MVATARSVGNLSIVGEFGEHRRMGGFAESRRTVTRSNIREKRKHETFDLPEKKEYVRTV